MSEGSALLLSIGAEAVVAAILVMALRWGSGIRAAFAAVIATLATHWLAWWWMLETMDLLGYGPAFAAIEVVVILVESVAYVVVVPMRTDRALVISLIANSASAGLGLALDALDFA